MFAPLALSLALLAPPAPPLCAAPPAAAGATCAPGADPLLAQVEPLLGVIDRPLPAGVWRRLPPGALAVLEGLALDPGTLPTRRMQALDGAAALGSSGAVHRRLASDGAAPYAVREAAIRGLAPLVTPDQALATLDPLAASDPDRRIRATAAEAMAKTSPARGCAAVRERLPREGADGRAAFRRALAACGER